MQGVAGRSSRVLIRRIAALTVVGGLTTVAVDERRRRDAFRVADSTRRIGNLVCTAALMGLDYGISLAWYEHVVSRRAGANNAADAKQAELRQLQNDQETITKKALQLRVQLSTATAGSAKALSEATRPQELDSMREMLREYSAQLNDIRDSITRLSKEIAADAGTGPLQHQRALFLHPIHLRNATRLRDMCASNRGLYIKLGQHLAMLDHIFPREYHMVLVSLLGNTPTSDIDSVKRVFREEFGKSIEETFDVFEETPIASASLAQVHIAWRNGRKLAVKVQHEGLVEGSDVDRQVITALADLMQFLFPSFRYQWLTKEMNRNLPIELDFRCERENLLTATNHLKSFIDRGEVAVPVPENDLFSKRVLAMSFEEGVYVSRMHSSSEHKHFSTAEVSSLISQIFSEQIFRNGFVHCDPHEANLLVRPHPTNPHRPQLVLLDHGLYRQLDDDLRRNYARLWQAIVLSDERRIEEYCRRMNAGNLYSLMAAVLTLKPWGVIVSDSNSVEQFQSAITDTAELIVLQNYAMKYYEDIVKLLDVVPSDLLLLLKTNDCLRHLDKLLHTPVNSTAVVASVASRVILEEDLADVVQEMSSAPVYTTLSRAVSALSLYAQVQSRSAALSVFGRTLCWLTAVLQSSVPTHDINNGPELTTPLIKA